MVKREDFQFDSRVTIGMDALSDSQKAIFEPIFRSKEDFLKYAEGPGKSKLWSKADSEYVIQAGEDVGEDFRIFYSKKGENIVVEDIMRQVTLDLFSRKKKAKASSSKKKPLHPSGKK